MLAALHSTNTVLSGALVCTASRAVHCPLKDQGWHDEANVGAWHLPMVLLDLGPGLAGWKVPQLLRQRWWAAV
jgi:hypothetical protein